MLAPLLDVEASFCVASARDSTPCQVSKARGFCSIFKNVGKPGTFEEDLQRCISRGRRTTRDTWVKHVRRSGRWFFERGCIFEHQLFRFGKVILRDRCSTWHLASLSRGTCNTLDRWTGKIAKTQWYEAVSFALSFPNFEGSLAELLRFWCCQLRKLKKSCRIVSFSGLQIDRETDR